MPKPTLYLHQIIHPDYVKEFPLNETYFLNIYKTVAEIRDNEYSGYFTHGYEITPYAIYHDASYFKSSLDAIISATLKGFKVKAAHD